MNQYGTAEFSRALKRLSKLARSGRRFGFPMEEAYREIKESINGGKSVRLYRYQRCDDKNLRDIALGRIHLSEPSEFNDIYDSRPTFNLKEIRRRMEKNITAEGIVRTAEHQSVFILPELQDLYAETIRSHISNLESHKRRLLDATEETLFSRYDRFRREIHCACFSSDPVQPVLWGNYADSYKGFVAAYEIDTEELGCLCAHLECGMREMIFSLCPILYDGRYDMSGLSYVLMDACAIFPYQTFDVYMTLIHSAIHKSKDWSYEKEWRLFTGDCEERHGDMYALVRPVELIAGPRTSSVNLQKLAELAEQLQIPLRRAIANVETCDDSLTII